MSFFSGFRFLPVSVHSYLPEREQIHEGISALANRHTATSMQVGGPGENEDSPFEGLTMGDLANLSVKALNKRVAVLGLDKRAMSSARRKLRGRWVLLFSACFWLAFF